MRKWKNILVVMTAALLLIGCGASNAANMNTVSIGKDGMIAHTIVEEFERNFYDVSELEAMAQEKIKKYSSGEGSIVCESVEANNGKVIVKMTYQTGEDYTSYNRRELFSGTVGEAFEKGYSLKDIVKEDGTPISDEELSSIRENHVVIVQTKAGEELDVNVYDKILYTSAGITLSGKRDAIIAAGEEELLSCIVFQ